MLLNLHTQSAHAKVMIVAAYRHGKGLKPLRLDQAMEWLYQHEKSLLPEQCFETGEEPF